MLAKGDGEGSSTETFIFMRDTDIVSNTGVDDRPLVMSEDFGASVEMIRNEFIENRSALVSF